MAQKINKFKDPDIIKTENDLSGKIECEFI